MTEHAFMTMNSLHVLTDLEQDKPINTGYWYTMLISEQDRACTAYSVL